MMQLSPKEAQEIYVEISEEAKSIHLQPGKKNASFQVKVRNDSAVYASFQLNIDFYDRIGNNQVKTGTEWYKISPEIGTLKPPGAWTTFTVEITQPPVPGFVGTMDLIITVSSDEINYQPRKILKNIQIEKGILEVLVLDLPVTHFKNHPGDIVEIPVYVYNPNYISHKNVQVKFKTIANSPEEQLDLRWLDSTIKPNLPLEIKPNQKEKLVFSCQIPDGLYIKSDSYLFTLEVIDPQSESLPSVQGKLEILTEGSLNFAVNPLEQAIKPQPRWKFWRSDPVNYSLIPQNNSNISQIINFEITGKDQEKCQINIDNNTVESFNQELSLLENPEIALNVNSSRPWIGFRKQLELILKVIWSRPKYLTNENDTQNLKLILKPIIPVWLQVLLALLFLWLIWLFSPLNPHNAKHKDAVNSVQFNGIGETVISGSNDQTVIAWNVPGFSNWKPLSKPKFKQFETGDTAKAVRVVRYRPVDNNIIATGLENGEIQLWDLLSAEKTPQHSFFFQKDDRVLGLEFTQNSRYLFSGHGSGLVLQWDL
jgi:WD40 repeat protein